MLQANILGYQLQDLIIWFWIYSFLGWIFESTYSSIHERKILNRGFVHLPFCIIYGFGALLIIIVLTPLKLNLIIFFIISIIFTSTLEYVVYVVLKKIFNQTWWDYSDLRYHYKGILSLESSIAWGVLSVLLVKVLHPQIVKWIIKLPQDKILIIVFIIAVFYVVDFCWMVSRAVKKR